MILTGNEIARQVALGNIRISDFTESRLSPNSYDLRLGDELYRYRADIVDLRSPPTQMDRVSIPEAGLVLGPNEHWLADTAETIESPAFVPMLHAKSRIARIGLFVHICADLMQVGWRGKLTFQLYSTLPVRVRRGARIGQVSFWRPTPQHREPLPR